MTSGEITINGAILRSAEKIHWVDAPHCHSLPVIRCSNTATIELSSNSNVAAAFRGLGRLSPHFRKLWNESPSSSPAQMATGPESTFQTVHSPQNTISNLSNNVNSYIHQPTVQKEYRCKTLFPRQSGIEKLLD